MRVGIDSHSLLLAGGVTLLTRCRCYLARVHVGIAIIDGHSLLLAGDATLLTRRRCDLERASIGVVIDRHSLLLAGGATLLTHCRCDPADVHGVGIDRDSLLY